MKKCPYCAEEIQDEAIVCKHCNRELVHQVTEEEETNNKRISNFQRAVLDYQNNGWILLSNVNGIAQLKKPKKFNWFWFIAITLFTFELLFIGAAIYLIYHSAKKEKLISLTTDPQGNILVNGKLETPEETWDEPRTPMDPKTKRTLLNILVVVVACIAIAGLISVIVNAIARNLI